MDPMSMMAGGGLSASSSAQSGAGGSTFGDWTQSTGGANNYAMLAVVALVGLALGFILGRGR